MNTDDELRHLLLGLRTEEEPKGFGIAGYRVTCRRDSFEVLECVKETLKFILTFHHGMESASNVDTQGAEGFDMERLLQEEVINQLAEWYRQRFNLNANDTSADCVRGFGRGRDWRWWDARIRTEEDFLLLLNVSGWPCSGLTALRRVLDKCGADSMDEILQAEW